MGDTATYFSFDSEKRLFDSHTLEIPALRRGELLVKILFTTICRSDLNTFLGKRKEKNPTILGHEAVGIVVDLAETDGLVDLRGNVLKPGDRITWAIYASDPMDPLSVKGIPQKARGLFKYGHEQISHDNQLHGGLSTHIILRKNTPVVVLSDSLSLYSSALINCAVATVAGALRLSGAIENKIVVINGAGMLGLVACAMARSGKATSVIAIDHDKDRLERAVSFGASLQWLPEEETSNFISLETGQSVNISADIVIDFTGNPTAMASSLELLGIGGVAVWVGATYPQPAVQLNAEKLVRNLWTIRGLHNYNQDDLLSAVRFMESYDCLYRFDELINRDCSIANITDGFSQAVAQNHFRVGFEFIQ
jgi:putative phosphonate catabolism associated alcohol dehydrogenase